MRRLKSPALIANLSCVLWRLANPGARELHGTTGSVRGPLCRRPKHVAGPLDRDTTILPEPRTSDNRRLASTLREVVPMTTGAESLSPSSSAEHVPIEDLARRQGVQPVESLADLACPELWDSDEEYERFLADLYASRRSGLA